MDIMKYEILPEWQTKGVGEKLYGWLNVFCDGYWYGPNKEN